jgi:hypothetical protein
MVSTPQGALNAFDYEADTEGQQPEQAQSPLAQLAANEPVSFDIDRAKRGILGIESGGNYEALGPLTRGGDRAYGKYQVMGANIPQWTEAALGVRMTPEAFLKDKDAQEKVFEHRFGQYVNKYGNVADAASAWFSGKPIAEAGNRSDVLGTTVPAYVSKFLASYNSEGAGQPRGSVADRQEATTTTAAAPSAQPKSNLDNLIKMLNAAEPKQQQGGANLLQQVMRQNAQAHQAARSKSLAQVAEFDKELVDKLAKQVQGYATGGQVTDNISKIYQDVLGRAPDAEGLAYWQQQADKGTSLDDIRKSFETSPEKQIQSYYSDILGRAPDTEGLNYWQNRAAQGMNLGDIKSTFQNVAAQEFDPILEKQYAAANTGTATDASNAPQWKTWWGYNPNQKDYDALLRAGLGEAPAGSADQYRAIYEALGNRAALGSPYGSKGDIASVITPSQVQGAFNLSGIKSLLNTDAGQAAKQALDDYLAQGQNKVLTTQTDWRGFQNNQPSSGSYAGKLVPGDTSGLTSFNTFYNPIGNEKLAQQLADMQRKNNAIYGADPFVDVKDKPTDVVNKQSDELFVSNVPTGGYNPFDTTDFSSSYTSPTSSTDSYDPWKTTNDLNSYYNNFNSNNLTPPTWSTGTFNPGYSSLDYLGPMIGSFDFSPTWSSFKDGGQFKAMFDEDTPEMQDRAKELARSAYTNKLPKDQRKEWESLAAKYNLPLSLGEFNTYEDQYSDALSKWQRGLNPNERAQYHSLGGLIAKYAKGGEFKEVADEDVNPYEGQTVTAYKPTLRDRLANLLSGDNPSFDKQRIVENLIGSRGLGTTGMGAADFVPVLGNALSAQEALHEGDYKGAAMAMMPVPAGARASETWYHGISKNKLMRPLEQMSATTVEKNDVIPRKFITPADLEGGVIIPALGDRTAANKWLTHINETELPTPVDLEGGANFKRSPAASGPDQAAWASQKGVISRLADITREASKTGDPYLAFTAMSNRAGDYSGIMTDALLSQIENSKIAKKDIKAFDAAMEKFDPNWPGVKDENIKDYLMSKGPLKTRFAETVAAKPFQSAGFPDIGSTRFAITEPELLHVPTGSSGFAISKLDPSGRVITEPAVPHSTYKAQLGGEGYAGGFEHQLPLEIMYSDWLKSQKPELLANAAKRDYKFKLDTPTQHASPQWVDEAMKWLRQQYPEAGYAAGGLVDGGGTNIDGTGGLQYDAMGNLTESQGGPVHAIPYDQDAVNSLASQLQDGTYGK